MQRGFDVLARTAASQHGLLTTEQLRTAGYSSKRVASMVKSGSLERLSPRLFRVAAVPESWEQRLAALCLSSRTPAVASHRSALRLWGIRNVDDDLEATVRYPRKVTNAPGIVHRSVDLQDSDTTWIEGVRVTSPVRTLCDAGLIFPEREVARLVDHSLAIDLVSMRDLWGFRIRVGKQGRNGCGVLHRVLDSFPDDADRAESGPEVDLIRICQRFGLPAPAVQFQVELEGKRFRVDLGYPDQKVFCEFDGVEWHSSPEQIAADGGRQNILVSHGWRPLRFSSSDLAARPADVASRIRHTLGFSDR
ncbi:MAG: AbiEi antitoxin N-terminal domain-containing protein [Acidobacteria bacterium]|nr:AbiEi antitoxin N-terminal domain-containing protein [Acidobacteriota bacterium]